MTALSVFNRLKRYGLIILRSLEYPEESCFKFFENFLNSLAFPSNPGFKKNRIRTRGLTAGSQQEYLSLLSCYRKRAFLLPWPVLSPDF